VLPEDDTEADHEGMDPDFYYGPRPTGDSVAISEEEMALQVAIASQQLKRLQLQCDDPVVKALFVRWTIHNWATQGPFNIVAFHDTLAEHFAACRTESSESSRVRSEDRCPRPHIKEVPLGCVSGGVGSVIVSSSR